jgi:hypothetical protein
MAWYWWVLIGIGVVGIGALKLKFFKAWMEKRKEQNQPIEDE